MADEVNLEDLMAALDQTPTDPPKRPTRRPPKPVAVEPATVEEVETPVVYISPTTPEGKPLPEAALTPEQKQIRDLQEQLAAAQVRNSDAAEPDYEEDALVEDPNAEDVIVIHFREDGFSAFETIWYRGQELRIVKNSPHHLATKDRNGNSWLDLADDEFGQADKYGKVMFRSGPWPGKAWTDPEAANKEKRRAGRPPVFRG